MGVLHICLPGYCNYMRTDNAFHDVFFLKHLLLVFIITLICRLRDENIKQYL